MREKITLKDLKRGMANTMPPPPAPAADQPQSFNPWGFLSCSKKA